MKPLNKSTSYCIVPLPITNLTFLMPGDCLIMRKWKPRQKNQKQMAGTY